MGKYLRKAKASGEVAVMEVPGGVRTRSRTLALQQRAPHRPPDKGDPGEYLELRSRRLEKPPHPQAPSPPARRPAGNKSSGSTAAAAVEDQVSFGEENVPDFEDAAGRSTRETTPCSLIRNSEMIRTPGSTTKSKTSNSMTSHRRMEASPCRYVPTSFEMEEFFAASEQQAQHAFKERYNFCPVNDCPLPGRYEWMRLDC